MWVDAPHLIPLHPPQSSLAAAEIFKLVSAYIFTKPQSPLIAQY